MSPAVKGQALLVTGGPEMPLAAHCSSKPPGTQGGSEGDFQNPQLLATAVPKEEISKGSFSPLDWRQKDTQHM